MNMDEYSAIEWLVEDIEDAPIASQHEGNDMQNSR